MGGSKKIPGAKSPVTSLSEASQHPLSQGGKEEWRKFVIKISAAKIRALGFFTVCVALSLRIVSSSSFADERVLSGAHIQDILFIALVSSVVSGLRSALWRGHAKRER